MTIKIPDRIAQLAAERGGEPAITDSESTINFSDLYAETNRLARVFAERGVVEGDLVAVALPNGIAMIESMLSAWLLGAVPLPLSCRLPQHERDALVELARPKLLVVGDEKPAEGCLSRREFPGKDVDASPLPPKVSPHACAIASGGSTGRPKLIVNGRTAMLPIDPSLSQDELDAIWTKRPGLWLLGPAHPVLVPGPLYHSWGFWCATIGLMWGQHVVVMKRFDAEEFLQLVERHRIHWSGVVPTMMQRIWKLPEEVRGGYDVSSLRRIIHTAAPCPPWLKQAWIDWLGPEVVHEMYSMSESLASTSISGTEWLQRRGSVGRLMDGEIAIFDEEGRRLGPNQIGEVYLRSREGADSRYRYVGAEPNRRGDWDSVGDMGYFDEDGYLFLCDRKLDMVITGGANVYPAEVEGAIDAHPLVRTSCVIGLPDDDLGQRLHAIVDTGDAELSQAELVETLEDKLARYKIPRSFEFVSEPLRDQSGKVRRSALREQRLRAAS